MTQADRDTAVSDEQFAPVADGIDLCYQTFGDPSDEPLLLVMGLGGPMIWWHADLCRRFAEAGFFVIRYDNRDIGRSGRVRFRMSKKLLFRAFAGLPVDAPYSIEDLAGDAFALLDHLGIDSAHVAGISMGGMIGQTMAIARPERVRSLTSIMSSTGKRTVGWQHPSIMPALLSKGRDREAYIRSSVAMWKLIGSPAYPQPESRVRERAGETFDRGFTATGVGRQMLAVLTQPDRSEALGSLTMPVCVVHGLADKMVHVSGGRATAKAVPDSELVLVEGWGHDIPPALWSTFVDAVRRTADRTAIDS